MSGNLKYTSKIKGHFFLISPWQQITLGFGTLESGLRGTVIDIFVDLVKVKLKFATDDPVDKKTPKTTKKPWYNANRFHRIFNNY